jgi:hypothetical protein
MCIVFSSRPETFDKNFIVITPQKLFVPFICWLRLQADITPTICTKDLLLRAWAKINGIKTRPYSPRVLPFDKEFPEPDEIVRRIGEKKIVKILNGVLISDGKGLPYRGNNVQSFSTRD